MQRLRGVEIGANAARLPGAWRNLEIELQMQHGQIAGQESRGELRVDRLELARRNRCGHFDVDEFLVGVETGQRFVVGLVKEFVGPAGLEELRR